jgi:hypothetical protein
MRCHRVVITLLVGAVMALTSPVSASVSGRRNTAIGATALSLYELARGKTGTGLLAGAGAYYAWHQYNKAHRRESRRSAFLRGYREGVRRSYRTWRADGRFRRGRRHYR